MEPLVSVIMPVYNVEKYLDEALQCLLRQTMADFEVIMVDDGSTDNSPAILRAYAEKDARFSYFRQQNSYAGVARNNGLNRARGKYVLFLDPDDAFEARMLEETTAAAEKQRAQVVAFGYWRANMSTGVTSIAPYSMTFRLRRRVFAASEVSADLFQLCLTCPWNKLILRSYLMENEVRFQPIRNTNDVYFAAMALLHAERIYCLKKRFVYYRCDNPQSLQGSRKKSLLDFTVAMRGIYDHLLADGVYDTYRKSFMRLLLTSTAFVLGGVGCLEDYEAAYSRVAELFCEPLRQCPDGLIQPSQSRLARGLADKTAREYLLSCSRCAHGGCADKNSPEYRLGEALLRLPNQLKKLVNCLRNR